MPGQCNVLLAEASVPFSSGSSFQLSPPDLPSRAVTLVQEQHLQQKFGDFDDHLEDVTIGGIFDVHYDLLQTELVC